MNVNKDELDHFDENLSKRPEPDQDRQKWISIEDLETLYRTYLSRVQYILKAALEPPFR